MGFVKPELNYSNKNYVNWRVGFPLFLSTGIIKNSKEKICEKSQFWEKSAKLNESKCF
jgi:hypothetical protein